MKNLFIFIVLVNSVIFSEQKSSPQDDHYIGAVVEYIVNRESTANLDNYIELIKEAAEKNADIIVFPEMTLTRSVSIEVPIYGALIQNPIPALKPELYSQFLVKLSEAAFMHQIYIVVNIEEILNCSTAAPREECPDDKTYKFNTNVVFNRYGAIIDRYRKINLFGEATRTPAFKPDLGVFSTDFGVTFGHFICFDLMFQVPAIQVVQKYQITDVVFPTMWFSELPYLTAVQIQEAYAYSENINFLAAGANNVAVGSAGSGIYSGKAGALTSIMPGAPTTRLLVAKIPKVPGAISQTYPGHEHDDPKTMDNLRLIVDPSIPAHFTRLLNPGSNDFTLKDQDVTCNFKVNFKNKNSDSESDKAHLRAFINGGINSYVRRNIGIASCIVVTCKDDNATTCPYRFNTSEVKYEMEDLEIELITKKPEYNNKLQCDNAFFYPSSFKANKFPLFVTEYTFNKKEMKDNNNDINEDRVSVTMKLNKKQDDLVAFGIWGRVYERDTIDEKEVTEEDMDRYREFEEVIYNDKDTATERNKSDL